MADFGDGFKGIWENSGTFEGASEENEYTDWEGQKIILKDSVWEEDWKDGTYEATVVVGDLNTSCLYFRYQDEENWYRVSLSGNDAWRCLAAGRVEYTEEGGRGVYHDRRI